MLVHQHGALLKIAGWVVFYLHEFMESLKHLFRSDSSAQYKDVSWGCGGPGGGECLAQHCFHALTWLQLIETALPGKSSLPAREGPGEPALTECMNTEGFETKALGNLR